MKSFKQLTEEIYKSGGSEVIMSKSEKDEIKSRKKMGIKIRKAKHAHTKASKRKTKLPTGKSSVHPTKQKS
jgi:hypothetical protein